MQRSFLMILAVLLVTSLVLGIPVRFSDGIESFLVTKDARITANNAVVVDLATVELWNNSWTLNRIAEFLSGYSEPAEIEALLGRVPERGLELGGGTVSSVSMSLGNLSLGLGLRNQEVFSSDRRLLEIALDGFSLEEIEDLELNIIGGRTSTFIDIELGGIIDLPGLAESLGFDGLSIAAAGHFLMGLAYAEIDASARVSLDQESFLLRGDGHSTTYLAIPSEGAGGIGASFDLSAIAIINEGLMARVTVCDLGAIIWSNVERLEHSIEFEMDPDGLINEDKEWVSIGELQEVSSVLSESMTRTLPLRLLIDVAYDPLDFLTLGTRLGMRFSNRPIIELAVGTTLRVVDMLPLSLSLTYRSDVNSILFGLSGHLVIGNKMFLGIRIADFGALFGSTKHLGLALSAEYIF